MFDPAVTTIKNSRPESSYSLGGRYEATRARLIEAFERASSVGWDGYDGVPMSFATLEYGIRFLWSIPSTVPMPEVAIDPDGEISFEWYKAPRWVLSVSVGPRGELAYAGLFGRRRSHGTAQFVDEIPSDVLHGLGRFLGKISS